MSEPRAERDPQPVGDPLACTAASGSIRSIVLIGSGTPVMFDPPAQSVLFIGDRLALVVQKASFGQANLTVLGPSGVELKTLGTTCGTGVVDQVLKVDGEIRVVESTPAGDFQARLDLESLTLERLAEWR